MSDDGNRIPDILDYGDAREEWSDRYEHFQPFSADRELIIREPGHVCARARHTVHQATAERIGDVHEHDWNSASLTPQSLRT
jgi:hypothetical protein